MPIDIGKLKQEHSLASICAKAGVVLPKNSGTVKICCPFHKEKTASCNLHLDENWFKCYGCSAKGDQIEFAKLIFKTNLPGVSDILTGTTPQPKVSHVSGPATSPKRKSGGVNTDYIYVSKTGTPLYVVRRIDFDDGSKTFKQGHRTPDGKAVWNLQGVQRVPFHYDKVSEANEVWISEGEKCSEALLNLGVIGTTTCGGANGWMDSYAQYFEGKDVIILPDYDEPDERGNRAGETYMNSVANALDGVAKSVRIVWVPNPYKKNHYDVADYIEETGDKTLALSELTLLASKAPSYHSGVTVPVMSFAQLESAVVADYNNPSLHELDLSVWLPKLRKIVKPLRTHDLMFFIGGTSDGKTAAVQNIMDCAGRQPGGPLNTLMFSPELSMRLLFKRQMALSLGVNKEIIEDGYEAHGAAGTYDISGSKHIYTCYESGLTLPRIEEIIRNSQLVIGSLPVLVVIDYIQLLKGKGSKYEIVTDLAEGLRELANRLPIITVVLSQIGRRPEDLGKPLNISSAKNSGSIENSGTHLFGIYATGNSNERYVQAIKITDGQPGGRVKCDFDGTTMRLTQAEEDISGQSIEAQIPFDN